MKRNKNYSFQSSYYLVMISCPGMIMGAKAKSTEHDFYLWDPWYVETRERGGGDGGYIKQTLYAY